MEIVQYVTPLLIVYAPLLCEARLSDHFIDWISKNGYKEYDFARDDVGGLSFGGKTDENETLFQQPVIFVHGVTGNASRFNETRAYFLNEGGYKESEIYATTWGIPKDGDTGFEVYYSKEHVMHVRKFVEAVIAYTGVPLVDILGHSMGVVMSRIIIKGGPQWDNGPYDVGEPLTDSVDTFVGIAGLNFGFIECYDVSDLPFCNDKNGHYPGVMAGTRVVNSSQLLQTVNEDPGFEGKHRYSIFTIYDEDILNGGLVYCHYTSHVPESHLDIKLTHPKYKHMTALSLTPQLQLGLVRDHIVIKKFKKYIFKPNHNSCA